MSTLTEEQIKARRQYVDKCLKLEEQLSEAVQHTIETHASKKDPEVSPAQAVAQHLLRVANDAHLKEYEELANEANNVKAEPDENSDDNPLTLSRWLSQTDVASAVGQIICRAMIRDDEKAMIRGDDVDQFRHRPPSPPPFPPSECDSPHQSIHTATTTTTSTTTHDTTTTTIYPPPKTASPVPFALYPGSLLVLSPLQVLQGVRKAFPGEGHSFAAGQVALRQLC